MLRVLVKFHGVQAAVGYFPGQDKTQIIPWQLVVLDVSDDWLQYCKPVNIQLDPLLCLTPLV